MEMKAKYLLLAAAFSMLVGCDCGSDKEAVDLGAGEVATVEDEALRGTAADFIANAGDRVFFDFDKSDIKGEAEATLLRQSEWLHKHASRKVLIEGHCDERGTREYNLGLGERRANAAAKLLESKGISPDRIRVVSYGKDRPIAVQGAKADYQRMNRVAIAVIEQ